MKIIRRINRRYLYLAVLLLAAGLYIVYKPFKSFGSEVIFLFTSKSSQLIIGYLNSYDGIRPAVSIGLMVLQALIFPFKYEIMIFANIEVFGKLIGLGLSLIGRIIGAYVCYDIGKTLISKRIELIIRKLNISEITTNHMRSSRLVHVFIRVLPLNFDLISYLAGIMELDSKKYMLNSMVWITLTTVTYSVKQGYFSYNYEMGIAFIRVVLSIIVFSIIARNTIKVLGGYK